MGKRALVIANGVYDDGHFAALPAAPADASALTEVLGDPAIGGFDVTSLVDAGQRTAMRALESFFLGAGRDDLLLLHLSLHGWKDLRNRLYFVMKDTERGYPGSTAVAADVVSDWITQSRSKRIVLTLDCCYSGAFPLGARLRSAPAVDLAEPLGGQGRAVITASTSLQYAHEGGQVRSSLPGTQPSVFTAAVVGGLRSGAADVDGDGLVSVQDLYEYVHDEVRRRIPGQTPTLSVDSTQGVIHLARSPRNVDGDALADMRAAVADPQAWKRVGALHLVERLLGSVREPTREAARRALLGLVGDADREVARKARELWHARGLGDLPERPRVDLRAEPAKEGVYIGIDFGTTNSAVGLYLDGDVRVIPSAEGGRTTPSLVAITEDGSILVGEAAKRQEVTNPDYTVRAVKLKLGTGWSIARGDVRLTAEQVAGLILAKLRDDAETYLGRPVAGAVLTVPANFGQVQRGALVRAAQGVGLNLLRMVGEPTAAAVAVGVDPERDQNVLVFDLGGGTLDVTVAELMDVGAITVLSTAGDNHIGGDDWDDCLVRYLVQRAWARSRVALDGEAVLRRLREAAEAAKIELSSASAARVHVPHLMSTPDGPFHLDEMIGRELFENLTVSLRTRCIQLIGQAMADAGVPASEIDQVILTGGATRMPAIGRMVREATGGARLHRGLIPEGVTTGAALQAGVLCGAVKDILLLDVIPTSIWVAVAEDATYPLVSRNTTFPTKRSGEFTSVRDDQPSVALYFTAGHGRDPDGHEPLALLELPIPPAPRGIPMIEVTADIDANGLIHLSAKDLGTGHEVTAVVDDESIARAGRLVRSGGWSRYRPRVVHRSPAEQPEQKTS